MEKKVEADAEILSEELQMEAEVSSGPEGLLLTKDTSPFGPPRPFPLKVYSRLPLGECVWGGLWHPVGVP